MSISDSGDMMTVPVHGSNVNIVWGTLVVISLLTAMVSLIRLNRLKAAIKQKKIFEQLRKKPYRLMVENSNEGILIIQMLEFKYANQKVYDLIEMPINELGSIELSDYIYPDDLNIVLENYEKIIFAQEKEALFRARVLKNDQTVIWINTRFVIVTWRGEPAVLAFIRDITEQKMMEQDLQQAQRMEAIGALSGGIAHDFNNILTTIIGNAEVAMMDLTEEEPEKKEFEQIRKSGYRARDLVRQILTISRESAMDVQPLYLTPMIKEAVKLLRSTLPKDIRIIECFDKQLGLVKADSIQLYQVFMNLCTNAKHAVKGALSPCIEVALKNVSLQSENPEVSNDLKPGEYVCMSVKDNGTGIDPEIVEKIFEPYFTTKEKTKGTGLGLATSSGIIKQYGGQIRFESTPDEGACFLVYLPLYNENTAEKPDLKDSQPDLGNGKVLFVDDEPEITSLAKRMFTSLGFSVMTANSGQQALDSFSRSPEFFDLMITDLSMPKMTGEELAGIVLRIRPDFPVIMCTGYSDTFDETAAKELGIAAYLEKPYNFKELSSIAISLIKKKTKAA
ncbi:MAG: response regulator [Desulfobacula sp.]|nr:response regulator [Desulfobacula sp.]